MQGDPSQLGGALGALALKILQREESRCFDCRAGLTCEDREEIEVLQIKSIWRRAEHAQDTRAATAISHDGAQFRCTAKPEGTGSQMNRQSRNTTVHGLARERQLFLCGGHTLDMEAVACHDDARQSRSPRSLECRRPCAG